MKPSVQKILALLIVLTATVTLLWSMPNGAVLDVDSLVYVSTAESIAERGAFEGVRYDSTLKPTVIYPPVYPLLLAPKYLLGITIPWWGALLNMVFFAGSLWLLYRLLSQKSATGSCIPLIFTALVAFNIFVLQFQRLALTESSAIFGVLLTIWTLTVFTENHRFRYLLLSGFFAALVMLTRYAEWPLLGTGVLGLLMFSNQSWQRKIRSTCMFGMIAGTPTVLWLLYNRLRTGSSTGYNVSFSWKFMQRLVEIWNTFSIILTHYTIPLPLRWGLLFIVLFTIIAIICRNRRLLGWRQTFSPPVGFTMLHVVLYIGFILVTLAFSSLEGMNLGVRRFVGSWMLILLVSGIWLGQLSKTQEPTVWLRLLRIFLIAYAGLSFMATVGFATRCRYRNEGFAGTAWENSPAWKWLDSIPEDEPVFSNGIDVVYYHTGRLIQALPTHPDRSDSEWEKSWQTSWNDFESQIQAGNAYILFFHDLHRDHYFFSEEQLQERYPLVLEYSNQHASIYRCQ